MKHTQKFTHRGWFGICPVYVGELDSDCPCLTPLHDNVFFETLFVLSHYGFMVFFTVADILAPNKPLGFPIVVTEELLVPHLYEYDEAE